MNDLISRQTAIRFIRDKVSLSLFMKRSVDKADKACMELCDMLDRELPSVQQEQRWIPVSERLPETDGYYLVTIKTFGWNGEQYEDVDIARYERKNGWLKADKCIAWMSLAEPYKGEES